MRISDWSSDVCSSDLSVRLRNSQVDAVKVKAAMTTSGSVLASTSRAGIPFRNTPITITWQWRIGLITVAACSQSGMFSIGVANPDSRLAGEEKRNAQSTACCWVCASEANGGAWGGERGGP